MKYEQAAAGRALRRQQAAGRKVARWKRMEDGTITLEKIAEFVGLSVDEVKKIKTDQNIPLG